MPSSSDVVPLKWEPQAITMSYERVRMGRVVGQHTDGFTVTAARTVAVPVERLYDAFVDEATRRSWMGDGELRQPTATKPRCRRGQTPEDFWESGGCPEDRLEGRGT